MTDTLIEPMASTPKPVVVPPDYAPTAPAPPALSPGATRPFSTLMCVEGRWTGDDRIIMADGLRWDGLLPMSVTIDHEGVEEIVGRVDTMERLPGSTATERYIIGHGLLDLGSEIGVEVERLIEGGFVKGVSIETDDVAEGGVDPADPALEPGDDLGWMQVTETARVRALSVVTTPAFAEAYITFDPQPSTAGLPPEVPGPTALASADMPVEETPDDGMPVVIVAAAGHTITIPNSPPAEWFTEPVDVEIAGALTVTDEGRVYGLLAPKGAFFATQDGYSRQQVPMGNVNYGRFLAGETPVAGGGRVVTGNITMGCDHGPHTDHASRVAEHYANTCSLAATVAVGERSGAPAGVWVAGALMPGVSADQVRRMMACQLSGHWLPAQSGYGYDLLAALLVPVPAFGMARRAPSVVHDSGALVASYIPVEFASGDCGCGAHDGEPCGCNQPTVEDRLTAIEASLGLLGSALRPAAIDALRARIAR